ncbi:MAG: O-antigen ligase family protein [Lacunisphaera sp.]
MALSLTATALVYISDTPTMTMQVAGIICVWVALLIPAIFSANSGNEKQAYGRGLKSSLIIITATAAFTLFPLLRSSNYPSMEDQITTIAYSMAVFMTAGLYLFHIARCGYRYLILGYAVATFIGPTVYIAIALRTGGFDALVARGTRLTADAMHPNLFGFCCVGFASISIMIFCVIKAWWRWLYILPALLSVFAILMASSRGSLVAIIIGGGCMFLINLYHDLIILRRGFGIIYVILFSLVIGIIVMLLFFPRISDNSAVKFISDKLELFSRYRGLDTGLTGRMDIWRQVFARYGVEDFISGIGPRKSGAGIGNIDNGYLVIFLEYGLIAGGAIILRLCYSLFYYLSICLTTKRRLEYTISVCLSFVAIVYLTNNIVARYLFGIGSSFSLFGILLFSTGPSMLHGIIREIADTVEKPLLQNRPPFGHRRHISTVGNTGI